MNHRQYDYYLENIVNWTPTIIYPHSSSLQLMLPPLPCLWDPQGATVCLFLNIITPSCKCQKSLFLKNSCYIRCMSVPLIQKRSCFLLCLIPVLTTSLPFIYSKESVLLLFFPHLKKYFLGFIEFFSFKSIDIYKKKDNFFFFFLTHDAFFH